MVFANFLTEFILELSMIAPSSFVLILFYWLIPRPELFVSVDCCWSSPRNWPLNLAIVVVVVVWAWNLRFFLRYFTRFNYDLTLPHSVASWVTSSHPPSSSVHRPLLPQTISMRCVFSRVPDHHRLFKFSCSHFQKANKLISFDCIRKHHSASPWPVSLFDFLFSKVLLPWSHDEYAIKAIEERSFLLSFLLAQRWKPGCRRHRNSTMTRPHIILLK